MTTTDVTTCSHPYCEAPGVVQVNRMRMCVDHIEWGIDQRFEGSRVLRMVAGMQADARVQAWLAEAGRMLRLAALVARTPDVDDSVLAESCDAVALQAEDILRYARGEAP